MLTPHPVAALWRIHRLRLRACGMTCDSKGSRSVPRSALAASLQAAPAAAAPACCAQARHCDGTTVNDPEQPTTSAAAAMKNVEAQRAVHASCGPARAGGPSCCRSSCSHARRGTVSQAQAGPGWTRSWICGSKACKALNDAHHICQDRQPLSLHQQLAAPRRSTAARAQAEPACQRAAVQQHGVHDLQGGGTLCST